MEIGGLQPVAASGVAGSSASRLRRQLLTPDTFFSDPKENVRDLAKSLEGACVSRGEGSVSPPRSFRRSRKSITKGSLVAILMVEASLEV